jgi:hypothetical protein
MAQRDTSPVVELRQYTLLADASFAQYFDTRLAPALRAAGAEPIARSLLA